MESNLARMITTAVIWTALLLMAVTAMVTKTSVDFWMILIGLGAGAVTTMFIWDSSNSKPADSAGKSKRSGRVDRMLDKLSEAELAELRARLIESDGEMLSLNDVLTESERRTRGR
ncbi:MAG: hypothetical protein HZC41_07135 [Chloroflexi bacterium]|nr:hypothetical protein [Chloroflexota bacterium]